MDWISPMLFMLSTVLWFCLRTIELIMASSE